MRSAVVIALVLVAQVATSQPKPAKAPKPTVSEILRGKSPGSVELLQLAPLGTPTAELAKRFPNYDASVPMFDLRDAHVLPEDKDAKVTGYWINGVMRKTWPGLVTELTTAWGEPVAWDNPIGPVKVWLDAAAKVSLRAQIVRTTDKQDHSNWFLRPYTPLATLFSTCTSKQKLLGATRAQLDKAYGKAFDGYRLACGEHEWDDLDIRVDLEADRVVEYRMSFHHGGNPRLIADYSALVKVVLGKVPDPAAKDVTVTLPGATAYLTQNKDSWYLRVAAVSTKSP